MSMTALSLIKRFNKLKAMRGNWETLWDEVATYVLPNKADFISERAKGEKRGTEVYDSTAIQANQLLAASLQGSLIPANTRWFDLRFRSDMLNDNQEASEWLQECGDRMTTEFNQSNLNTECGESFQDLGCFGTAPLLFDVIIKKDGSFGGFNFQSLHLGGVIMDANNKGKIDTIFRKFQYTARQAMQEFGEDAGEKIIKDAQENPDKSYDFLQVIVPRQIEGEFAFIAPPKMRQFACYYINMAEKIIVKESGYYELPILSPRWGKITGDIYGFSPALTGRADIRTLNEARRLSLTAWEKTIDPPVLAERNAIMGKFSFKASSVNYVKDINGFREMPQATNWNADQLMLQDVRTSVRRIFFADQLELQEGPNMTATEVEVRYELMQRMLGSTFGRLQSEFLTPLVERAFYAMLRNNALPQPPEVVLQEGGDLDIEYIGALARSQRMEDVTNIQRLAQSALELSQAKPEVLDKFNADEALDIIAKRLGTPAAIINSDKDVAKTRQARANQMAQDQADADDQAGLEAASTIAGIQQMTQ